MDVSLYDYLYNHKETEPTEVKFTDAGRQVFGGGGIAPDVMVSPPTPNAFQQSLLQRNIFFPYRGGVGSFTTHFLGTKPGITKDLVVDDDVIALFRNRLDQEKISYTEEDFNSNLDWIKRQIRKEAFLSVFGLAAADKIALENDVQVAKAVESLPQARTLYEKVRRVTAQRLIGERGQP